MDRKTMDYYETNAKTFAEGTVHVDFSNIQNIFLQLLPMEAFILDFGCGSGRDTKYFLEHGYRVEAIDGSAALCEIARAYTGGAVKQMRFQELEECERYDGIWACASILHVEGKELPDVFQRMSRAVKKGGIIYVSFKYGTFEGERNGRYFTDMTEEKLKVLLDFVPELHIEETWITSDVREGRADESWLNLILRKK